MWWAMSSMPPSNSKIISQFAIMKSSKEVIQDKGILVSSCESGKSPAIRILKFKPLVELHHPYILPINFFVIRGRRN